MTRELRQRLTYQDLLKFPEDGLRHELIDGVHFMTPAPYPFHQRVTAHLFAAIYNFLERFPIGKVYFAPCDIVFTPYDVVEPDILYISNASAGIICEKNIQGAPDIAIEVLSRTTRRRDQTLKRDLYERQGVKEYWLVDPDRRRITVYRLKDGRFQEPVELFETEGDCLTTPLLSGFEAPLKDVFQD